MKQRHKKAAAPAASPPDARVGGRERWAFKLAAVVVAPILLIALCEAALRVAGLGHPTGFLLRVTRDGRELLEQNNKFGWRFFGAQLARLPNPISIPATKPAGARRVFVFGESAAKGDPQPQFGLSRMLETMLSARHPGVKFEVVNTAMTAIDSHVILPIARDCADAGGDVWVVYMGNNEVVGPYGAGTVFGGQAPPLWLIRGQLALKTTRIGQGLGVVETRLRQRAGDDGEWRGMKMFLNQQVAADDPPMEIVYRHFARNLADIIAAGRHSGAGIVLSTVAVNLRDCAPLGSEHRKGLSGADKAKWDNLYDSGGAAADAGKNDEAQRLFAEAARIDDQFAELRFRQGQCALALGKTEEARTEFQAARDLDTLRFRCDARLNELTRRAASEAPGGRVLLADAEADFALESANGLPGGDLFYEHVHLTFDGNYLLAKSIGDQVEKLLAFAPAETRPWPSVAECAKRLGWTDWSRLTALDEIYTRISGAPFTGQLHHDASIAALRAEAAKLSAATTPEGIHKELAACQAALAGAPDDPPLLTLLASLEEAAGDRVAAAAAARREVALLPGDSEGWRQLAMILAQPHPVDEAADAMLRAEELDPENPQLVYYRAQILGGLGRKDSAVEEYRRALNLQPHFSLAWIGLGEMYEQTGRGDAAQNCFTNALGRHAYPAEAAAVARFCRSRGWLDAAQTNFVAAIRENAADAPLRIEGGQNAMQLGRFAEAAELFGQAERLAPDLELAHFSLGAALGQLGKDAQAADEFRAALRLEPAHVEARLDLSVALIKLGRLSEAHDELQETLRECPTNALAAQYLENLRPAPPQ